MDIWIFSLHFKLCVYLFHNFFRNPKLLSAEHCLGNTALGFYLEYTKQCSNVEEVILCSEMYDVTA